MSAQDSLVLGTPTVDFDPSVLQSMLNRTKTADDLKAVKTYILSYFVRTDKPVATWMWRPSDHNFEIFEDTDVKKRHIYKDKVMITLGEGQRMEIDIQQWFFIHYRKLCKVASKPLKPRSYIENGIRYLNQFPDYLHSKSRSFQEFNQKVKDIVMQKVLRHICKIWCSGKKELTEYVIDWLAHMINGEKVPTALYLKSVPGTGKSIICQFILEKVLGEQMVYKTSDPDQVAGKFNSAIVGKLLLYLEEMPKKSNLEWTAIADRFKDLIDGRRIDINEKGKPSYNTDNTASIIVNTNRNAVRIDTNDRRWVFLDVSDERVGDHEYFDDLGECLEKPEVAEAFFAYMCERARIKPDWVKKQAKKIPRTDTKQEQIVRNLDSLYIYIKERYIKYQHGLDTSQSEFYKQYTAMYENRAHDKYTVGSMMASLGFKRGSKYLKQKRIDGARPFCYVISYDELYALFDKKGWIHSIDREDYGLDDKDNDSADETQKIKKISVSEPITPKPIPEIIPSEPVHSNPTANEDGILTAPIIQESEPLRISSPSSTKESESEPIPVKQEFEPEVIKPEIKMESKRNDIMKKDKKGKWTIDDEKLDDVVQEWMAEHPSKKQSSEPELKDKVYTNELLENLYETAKNMWKSDGGDAEDFDWEQFAIDIEDLSNHSKDPRKDYYHYSLSRAVQTYRNKVNGKNIISYDRPTYKEIAEKIRKYYVEDRGRIEVTPPEGYKTIPIEKIQATTESSLINEREWAEANGEEYYSDNETDDEADDDWYEGLKNV